jgi:hypothetical protein
MQIKTLNVQRSTFNVQLGCSDLSVERWTLNVGRLFADVSIGLNNYLPFFASSRKTAARNEKLQMRRRSQPRGRSQEK